MLDPHLVAASHGHVHQTDVLTDLLHGNYESVTTVGAVFPGTDLGLGVADRLDGEIVSVAGETWRIPADGIPVVAHSDLGMPFALSAQGGEPITMHIDRGTTIEGLSELVSNFMASTSDAVHPIAAVRIDGTFVDVLLRSEHKQDPPYPHLDQVLRHEVQFPFDAWEGTLVGFSFPSMQDDGTTIPGLHLHAISADRASGGHLHRATVIHAQMSLWCDDSEITIPRSRVQHAVDLLTQVIDKGAPQQSSQAAILLNHLTSAQATAADFAHAIALHDAYLHDPYLEKS
ncbi:MAG: acetolactate decarboxylase [Candidatus Nanopelagicales bacterium]|nr:acetolactate decarboxylase [Candidatus Nanopelagicales bacterium]MCF8551562.1 acetolactate decarboxylase [Candidatus Nanopelagicales bacterium]